MLPVGVVNILFGIPEIWWDAMCIQRMNDHVEVSCIAVYHAVDVAIPFDIKQNVPSNNPYDGVDAAFISVIRAVN